MTREPADDAAPEAGSGRSPTTGPEDREARLAEALRANLRRRKAAKRKPEAGGAGGGADAP